MGIQMRLSASDNRLYSPNRDLAYCSSNLVKRAMAGLDPDKQEQWVKDYLTTFSGSEEDLVKGAKCLADYMNTALTDPDNKEPYDALKKTGFFDLPGPAQTIICAKIGQVFLSAMFSSIRDVIKDPKEPHYNTKELAQIADDMLSKWAAYNNMPKWQKYILEKIKLLRKRLGI